MKWANMDTQSLLTTKTTHIISAHFTAMTKPSEILFNGTPKNWPEFEHHLLTEAENPTIRWNQELTNFQAMDGTSNRLTSLKDTLISLRTRHTPY
jgi:hypothetical protein